MTWSPDSSSLAYFASPKEGFALAVSRVGSQEPPRYFSEFDIGSVPAWSPDGRWIAFGGSLKESEDSGIILVSPDGKNSRQLPSPVEPALADYVLVWSQDSSAIYVASSQLEEARLDVVDVRTGKAQKVAGFGSEFRIRNPILATLSCGLAPGGKSFMATAMVQKSDLWIIENFPQTGRH